MPFRFETMPIEAALQVWRPGPFAQLRQYLFCKLLLDPDHLPKECSEQRPWCGQRLGHRARPLPGASDPYTRVHRGVARGAAEITPVEPDPGHAGEGRSR